MVYSQLLVHLKPPFLTSKHYLYRVFKFQHFFLQSTAVDMFFTEKEPCIFTFFIALQIYE